MPRMRRATIERRQRPKLDERIYRWLEAGRPDTSTLAISPRWAIFVLEGAPVHKWECGHGPNYQPNRVELFWDAVMAKVANGELEVGDAEHRVGDPPLVTEQEALSLMEQDHRSRKSNLKQNQQHVPWTSKEVIDGRKSDPTGTAVQGERR